MNQDLQQLRQLDEGIDRVCEAFGPDTDFEPNKPPPLGRPRFEAFLNSGLAVICGPKSNNLVGVCFHSAEAFDLFIHDNPLLQKTFVVKRINYRLLFFRSTDFLPGPSNDDEIEIFDPKTRIPVYLPSVDREFKEGQSVVQRLSFWTIKWPNKMFLRFRIELSETLYGPPTISAGKDRRQLNELFWAHLMCDLYGIVWDPFAEKLWWLSECKQHTVLITDQIARAHLHRLVEGVLSPQQMSVLQSTLRDKALQRTIDRIKMIAIKQMPAARDPVTAFIEEKIEWCHGTSITSSELFAEYQKHSHSPARPSSKREFEVKTALIIKQLFAISKSNSVIRDGKAKRGFYNLGFKSPSSKATEGTLGTFGTHDENKIVPLSFGSCR